MILTRALMAFIAAMVLLYINDRYIHSIYQHRAIRHIVITGAILYLIYVIGMFEGLPLR